MHSVEVKQIPKNLAMNIASFVCNVIFGLWLVPYLVGHLGIAAYGLVPLAMVFVEYVSFITQSFNIAVTRFLTIELRGEEGSGASAVFNSSLALMACLTVVQIVLVFITLHFLDVLVEIPEGLLRDAVSFFALTFAGFICSLFGGVFSVSMYSQNRLDLMRLNEIARLVIRVSVIILLFSWFGPSLVYIGVSNLLGGISLLLLSMLRWRQLTPDLSIALRNVDFSLMRPLAGMAGWIVVNSIGFLLFLRIDIYLVNRFIGAEACGEYAAVLQWSQLVRMAAVLLSGIITPLGIIYYAKREMEKLVRMLTFAVKLICISLAFPLAFLCAFSSEILSLWIGDKYYPLGGLMALQLCTLVVNAGIYPLFALNTAMNRVKIPALVTLIMGGLNVGLGLLLLIKFDLGYYGIALAGVVVLTCKNALFTPLYCAHILRVKKSTFLRPILSGSISFVIMFVVATVIRGFVGSGSLVAIGLVAAFLYVASLFPLIWSGLSSEERGLIAEMAPNNLQGVCRSLLLVAK